MERDTLKPPGHWLALPAIAFAAAFAGLGALTGCEEGAMASSAADSVRILKPNGGESFRVGDSVEVAWVADHPDFQAAVIELRCGDRDPITLNDGGGIGKKDPTWGRLNVVLPDSVFDAATETRFPFPSSDSCRVCVYDYGFNHLNDGSDHDFSIQP